MKRKVICNHCGAAMMEFRHNLNVGLVDALMKISLSSEPVNLRELSLTRTQWTNFQKLRYWNLVSKVYDGVGNRVAADWVITDLGLEFVQGKVSVAKAVWTYRGKTIRYEEEKVFIFDVDSKYQSRQAYAEESKFHNPDQLSLL